MTVAAKEDSVSIGVPVVQVIRRLAFLIPPRGNKFREEKQKSFDLLF